MKFSYPLYSFLFFLYLFLTLRPGHFVLTTSFLTLDRFSLWSLVHSHRSNPLAFCHQLLPLFPWSLHFFYSTFQNLFVVRLRVAHPTFLSSVLTLLARLNEWRATYFIELTSVDRFSFVTPSYRFALTYRLASCLWTRMRLEIQVRLGEPTYALPTLCALYPGLIWSEREVWDMMGIRFRAHPDLRRLLTDYGFRGFPLRKEFPVIGFQQVRYDELSNSVIYESLYLMQEEREPRTVNPWLPPIPSSFLPTLNLHYLTSF
jgi:NADH-quinone oxidoreductase subunit C